MPIGFSDDYAVELRFMNWVEASRRELLGLIRLLATTFCISLSYKSRVCRCVANDELPFMSDGPTLLLSNDNSNGLD